MDHDAARLDTCPGCGAPLDHQPGGKLYCPYRRRSIEPGGADAAPTFSTGIEALKRQHGTLSEKYKRLENLYSQENSQKTSRLFKMSVPVKIFLLISCLAALSGVLLQWTRFGHGGHILFCRHIIGCALSGWIDMSQGAPIGSGRPGCCG